MTVQRTSAEHLSGGTSAGRASLTYRECSSAELLDQIGWRNVSAISGGRVQVRETGVTLPVHAGYSVEIDLTANDTYTVRRVFTRAGKRFDKGTTEDVYADQVGESPTRRPVTSTARSRPAPARVPDLPRWRRQRALSVEGLTRAAGRYPARHGAPPYVHPPSRERGCCLSG